MIGRRSNAATLIARSDRRGEKRLPAGRRVERRRLFVAAGAGATAWLLACSDDKESKRAAEAEQTIPGASGGVATPGA